MVCLCKRFCDDDQRADQERERQPEKIQRDREREMGKTSPALSTVPDLKAGWEDEIGVKTNQADTALQ